MNKHKLLVVLILLPVVCSLFFSVGSVSGYDLELDGYAHYKVIAYEAGVGAGADYQVVVVCHYGTGSDGTIDLNNETVALLHVGDIQADFDDVRFANQFGELLVFKRCSYTSAVNATFVVKVEANLDVDQLVYVYFGNGEAVDASSDNALVDVISGVVGAFPLEEAVATDAVEDYSGNGNDGTATGTTIVTGKFTSKTCRDFDGASFITLVDDADLQISASDLTFCAFVKPTNYTNAIAILGGEVGAASLYLTAATGQARFLKVDTSNGPQGANGLTAGVWTFLVATFDTSETADNALYYRNTDVDIKSWDVDFTAGASTMYIGAVKPATYLYLGSMSNVLIFKTVLNATQLSNISSNYPDVTLVAGSVLVRKWATTTLPAVAGVSDEVDNSAFSPVVDGALTDTEWFISALLMVLVLANVVLLAFPFALLRFVFGVLSFALSAWAFTYWGLPLAPYLQVMGLVVSVVCMFLASRARE